jgi:hypothetical protein
MARRLGFALLVSFLTTAGCDFSARLDTTDDARYEASLKKMQADMSDTQKRQFAADRQSALGQEAVSAVMKQTFSKDKGAAPLKQSEVYKSLNGMTVDQIHAKAEENRTKRKKS